jgi:beta-aspartyl-dipeptidase (metallo-type)
MFTCIKDGLVYNPDKLGKKDILIFGDKIARISEKIDIPDNFNVKVIYASGKIVIPGLVDLHIHILGGGGESGPQTRVPEIVLSKIVSAGVTTIVSCLGFDGVSRSLETLLAKALQLEQEGISAYIYTGSFQYPISTITGSVTKDIFLVPKIIGVGEVAISDHRSSQPTFEELCRLAAEARIGGLLGGKAGLVHLHVGNGKKMLDPVLKIINETEIPITQFLPTHLNRSQSLLEQSIQFAKLGGYVDFTCKGKDFDWPFTTSEVVQFVLERGVSLDKITLSTDANGAFMRFDENTQTGKLEALGIDNLFKDLKELLGRGFLLEEVLKLVTSNPAQRVGIHENKGSLAEGKDADLLILNEEFEIETVIAKGQLMVEQGNLQIKGTFEI